MVEKSSGFKVKMLQSDIGGEYTSSEFSAYLILEGIRQELTIPHTPQQNVIGEMMNCTLVEGVRTMLADSRLPHKFWAEALSTQVYQRKHSLIKALTEKTPYEAWYGAKPDVSLLKIFGCSAYAHVPKAERHTLDVKSRKCLMLAYGSTQRGIVFMM